METALAENQYYNEFQELREAYGKIDMSNPWFQAEYEKNISNQRWRLNNIYTIITEKGLEIPFSMNNVQTVFYLEFWYFNVVLKARQHGITTEVCLLFLDYCYFNSNMHAIFISYNKDEQKETFHEKIRFAYDRLPTPLKETNPATKDSATGLRFANGSSIRVTTSGRGGTFQLGHVSEYGKICADTPKKAREIRTGTLNAIHPGQFFVMESTAEGREGDFYRVCEEARQVQLENKHLGQLDFKFFFFPWYDNPLNQLNAEDTKNQVILDYQLKYFDEVQAKTKRQLPAPKKAWYVAKMNQQGSDMQREHPSTVEEAFQATIEGAYYRAQFLLIRQEDRITGVPYTEGYLVDTWWDLGVADATAIWFTQDVGRYIHVINYYENSGEEFKHYAKHLDGLQDTFGYRYGRHVAPHDARQRDRSTAKSYVQSAEEQGFRFDVAPNMSRYTGIEWVRKMLRICYFDKKKCAQGIKALENYRKKWDSLRQTYEKNPIHDWASHGADAFRTLGMMHKFRDIAELATTGTTSKNAAKKDKDAWT